MSEYVINAIREYWIVDDFGKDALVLETDTEKYLIIPRVNDE